MPATSAQRKAYRKQIGNALKVRFPDGRIIHAWQLWEAAMHSSNPAAAYLPTETARIEALYSEHAPEVPCNERRRRAVRMALKLAAFEVVGPEAGDASDLRVLALSNGLTEQDFTVGSEIGEPMLAIDPQALRQLGAAPGDSTAIH